MSTYSKSAQRLHDTAVAHGWTVEETWWTPDGLAGGLRFTRGTQIANVRFRENGAVAIAGVRQKGISYNTRIGSKALAALLAEREA